MENTNKADVKKDKETEKPEKIKETGEESTTSTKDIPSITTEKDPIVEEKPNKPASESTTTTTTKPVEKPNTQSPTPKKEKPTKPNSPTPTPEKKKVWVEPVYEYVDKYEDQPVYENVTETYTEPVSKKVIDQPERTIKHEKWEIRYIYFYASSEKKVYNEKDYIIERNRVMDEDLPSNTTKLSEIHEGPLNNPDFYEWKTDISTYETIPATYKTITENVTKTRTVKKQTGTKKVKVGTEKKLVKEGYWKYE